MENRKNRPNLLVVVSDTMRAAHLGCYGHPSIHTPNIDAFARRATRFERAFPESLPTVPARRTIHTGRRVFPIRDYRPTRWDLCVTPGWEPMENNRDTLAENLSRVGYQTGFVTDTLPYFAPGYNFHRGFWQWEYVRGQQQDKWGSPFSVPDERLARYGDLHTFKNNPHAMIPMHLGNTAHVREEEDTSTARVFEWGMRFLADNVRADRPFYLLVDCFDPHEPWEAPEAYYRMYGDPGYDGVRHIHSKYGPADRYAEEEIRYMEAQYCGLVSLVDAWFGRLLDRLDELELAGNTAVFFIADHGTNFARNPRRIIGKPSQYMYPGTVRIPLLARWPDETGAGAVRNEFVYNTDMTATLYDLAGADSEDGLDGRSLRPLITGGGEWSDRDYVTSIYRDYLCYVDDKTWLLTDVRGGPGDAFDLEVDPECRTLLPDAERNRRFPHAWERLLADAGGEFIDWNQRIDETKALLARFQGA